MQPLSVENFLDVDSVLSVEGKSVEVGVGTNGVTVNIGEHNGLKGQIAECFAMAFLGGGGVRSPP